MTVTEAGPDQDADQLRQRLIELSSKLADLRGRLNEYLKSTGSVVGTVARHTGIKWDRLKRFSDGEVVISRGRGLTELCRFLQCVDLGKEITAISQHISDRHVILATCSPAVIETALGITGAYLDRAETASMAEFSEAFEEYSTVIQGVINRSKSALQALEDEDTRGYVNIMLSDGLDDRLATVKTRYDSGKQSAADRLTELVTPLLDRFGGKNNLARVFEVSKSTLHAAMTGDTGLETIQHLTAAAERLSRNGQSNDPPTPQAQATGPPPLEVETPDAEAHVAAVEPQGPAFQGEQLIRALLDMSREDMVAFVQTGANFQELERVQLLALRDALIVSAQVTTLLLNIGSQVDSKQARGMLQDDIGRVLQELEPAIRRFTFAYPNKLLEMHDSQRQVMAKGTPRHPKDRKGSK